MHEHAVFMPLAQLNTTVSGPGNAPPRAGGGARGYGRGGRSGRGGGSGGDHRRGRGGRRHDHRTRNRAGHRTRREPGKQPPSGSIFTSIIPIVLMFVVLYFFLFRGRRKQEKKRKDMISELKKGDRVMTIGGMIACVFDRGRRGGPEGR